jgi:hypothetical protein
LPQTCFVDSTNFTTVTFSPDCSQVRITVNPGYFLVLDIVPGSMRRSLDWILLPPFIADTAARRFSCKLRRLLASRAGEPSAERFPASIQCSFVLTPFASSLEISSLLFAGHRTKGPIWCAHCDIDVDDGPMLITAKMGLLLKRDNPGSLSVDVMEEAKGSNVYRLVFTRQFYVRAVRHVTWPYHLVIRPEVPLNQPWTLRQESLAPPSGSSSRVANLSSARSLRDGQSQRTQRRATQPADDPKLTAPEWRITLTIPVLVKCLNALSCVERSPVVITPRPRLPRLPELSWAGRVASRP